MNNDELITEGGAVEIDVSDYATSFVEEAIPGGYDPDETVEVMVGRGSTSIKGIIVGTTYAGISLQESNRKQRTFIPYENIVCMFYDAPVEELAPQEMMLG